MRDETRELAMQANLMDTSGDAAKRASFDAIVGKLDVQFDQLRHQMQIV